MNLTTHLSTPWGWKAELALLADLQQTVYPYKWLPISCRSGADQWKFSDQRPTFYHWATQPTTWNELAEGPRVQTLMNLRPSCIARGFWWRIFSKMISFRNVCVGLPATKLALDMFVRDRSTTAHEKDLFRSVKVISVIYCTFNNARSTVNIIRYITKRENLSQSGKPE